MVYKISIPPEIETMLNIFLNYISKVVIFFDKYQQVFVSNKILQNISVITSFQQNFQAKPGLLYLQSLVSTICKEGPLLFNDITNFIGKDKVSDTVDLDIKKYGIPENSSPFCLQLYYDILQSSNGIIKWTFLKPLLHGKILYTPDTPETMEIIYKANRTFRFLEKIKTFSKVWLTMSAIFKSSNQILNDSTLQMLLRNSFINNYVESQLNLSVGEFVKKLHIYGMMLGVNKFHEEQVYVLPIRLMEICMREVKVEIIAQ
ncbi:ATP-binding cassette sub-family A member 13-like [Aquarana catesbeiana]|uniref:ATP-binding cassette sub-family A member 13-like n=1 Tax=Aquarana catesbeiana TaxID=8400 RepID=UPI003CC9EB90